MRKEGQQAGENRKLAHLDKDEEFFFFLDWEIRVFLLV